MSHAMPEVRLKPPLQYCVVTVVPSLHRGVALMLYSEHLKPYL